MGQIYVDVNAANAANGITTLGPSNQGQLDGTWLNWVAPGGFTGHGWHFAYIPLLADWWKENCPEGYSSDEAGLGQWLSEDDTRNLDEALGNWDPINKAIVVGELASAGLIDGCLS